MIEKLIIDFFTRIEKNESITKNHGKAVFFIQELLEKKHGKFSYIEKKKAIRLQEKYIDKKENVNAKTDEFLRNVMAQYLNYENYEEYKSIQYPDREIDPSSLEVEESPIFEGITTTTIIDTPTSIKWYKKNANKLVVTASTVFMLVLSIYTYQNNYSIKGNCIIWKTDHFEKSSCLAKNAINNGKYAINIETFKRITVTDSTIFFKKNIPLVWYGKNIKGEGEYFTDRGFHPETLKRLNPITRPILNREKLLNE